MGGIARLCKMYGSIITKDSSGKEIKWLWDYAQDKPRISTEFTKEEMKASEKAKWSIFSKQITDQ